MSFEDDDECKHGMVPSQCAICSPRPAFVKPPPAPRPSRAKNPAAPRAPRAAAAPRGQSSKSGLAGGGPKLAGRTDYFGADAAFGVWWIDETGAGDDQRAEGVVRALTPPGATPTAAARNVGELRPGDRTVHVEDGWIVAVGLVVGPGEKLESSGWIASVASTPLGDLVEVATLPYEVKIEAGPPGPFTRQGFVQPGVCFPIPLTAATRLAHRLGAVPDGWAW